MNVGRRMSHPVITVQPNVPITQAHELMARENINQCPVVKGGKMVGLITEKDILKAYPSTATTLAVWEITSLIEKIKVEDIMLKEFKTVEEHTPIEVAARILVDDKISALPVLKGHELVGIITEHDVFKIMLEMLGARRPGVRFSVLMANQPGEIAKLSQAIYKNGGDITALSTFEGDAVSNFFITMKVDGIDEKKLRQIVEPLVLEMISLGEFKD
jgi:acetoin utilization protein AcuB